MQNEGFPSGDGKPSFCESPAAHVSDPDHSVHHAEQSDDLAENLHVIYDNRLHGVILRLKAVMTVFLVKTL